MVGRQGQIQERGGEQSDRQGWGRGCGRGYGKLSHQSLGLHPPAILQLLYILNHKTYYRKK